MRPSPAPPPPHRTASFSQETWSWTRLPRRGRRSAHAPVCTVPRPPKRVPQQVWVLRICGLGPGGSGSHREIPKGTPSAFPGPPGASRKPAAHDTNQCKQLRNQKCLARYDKILISASPVFFAMLRTSVPPVQKREPPLWGGPDTRKTKRQHDGHVAAISWATPSSRGKQPWRLRLPRAPCYSATWSTRMLRRSRQPAAR